MGRMAFIYYNPNPCGRTDVGDCAIRALAKALNMNWEETYEMYSEFAFNMCDIVSSNEVLRAILRANRFSYLDLLDYPDYYTAEDFCLDHPNGVYVLFFGSHVATVLNGNLYDSWNSLKLHPKYAWGRKNRPIF